MRSGGRGPRVVCLHGLFSNSATFERLARSMVERVGGSWCHLDLPGSGRSDSYPDGMFVHTLQYVLDVGRVVRSLGWKVFHVVTHSGGGVIGLYLTSLLSARVSSFVAIDVFVPNMILEDSMISERVHLLLEKYSTAPTEIKCYSKEEALKKIKFSRSTELSDASCEVLFERCSTRVAGGYTLKNDVRFFLSFMYPTITMRTHRELVKHVVCPFLFIRHSETSFLYDTPNEKINMDILKNTLGPKLKMVEIDGPHEMIIENPEPIAAAIEKHLTRLSSKI